MPYGFPALGIDGYFVTGFEAQEGLAFTRFINRLLYLVKIVLACEDEQFPAQCSPFRWDNVKTDMDLTQMGTVHQPKPVPANLPTPPQHIPTEQVSDPSSASDPYRNMDSRPAAWISMDNRERRRGRNSTWRRSRKQSTEAKLIQFSR